MIRLLVCLICLGFLCTVNAPAYAAPLRQESSEAAVEESAEVPAPEVADGAVVAAGLAAIASPALVQPADGGAFSGLSAPPLGLPAFAWQPVAGADRYNIQISASAGFGSPVVDVTTYATSYTPQVAFADGVYYWRVRGQVNYQWGPDSEIRSFSKDWCAGGALYPHLLSPANGSSMPSFAHEHFRWEPVPGAATYLLEIATDDTFSTVVYSANSVKPHHTPYKRLGNNTYYWRVTPIDHRDQRGQAGPPWSFTFAWNIAPELLAPADHANAPFLPTFTWTAVEAAEFYVLQISTQSDFAGATIYTTAATEFTPSKALSNDQDYYWRVKAIDNQGTAGPDSAERRFHSAWNFQPQLLTPVNNSTLRSYPFFSWSAVPGVERYQIQIDKSSSFGNPLADRKVYNATSYAEPQWRDVLIGQDYYWHVRGIDAQGNYTPWSNFYSFRIDYTNSPAYVYPPYYYAPDAVNLPVHTELSIAYPLFVWDTSFSFTPGDPLSFVRPDYYVLEVAADPTFGTVDFRVETAGLAAAPTHANPFNNLVDGALYYWRVRAMQGGVQMGADTVWLTRIDRNEAHLPFASKATPIYPADGFEAVETGPALGWLPVANADGYRVQLSRTRDFNSVIDEAVAQSVNYAPWQGRREAIPFGTYWWRVRAEDAHGASMGGWSETRHFNISVDLVNGNPYDLIPPAKSSSILSTTAGYSPELTAVADGPGGPQNDFALDKLHVMLDHVYNGSYNWVFAFEVAPSIVGNLRYGIYIDADHKDGSGASTDPLGKPIQVDSLYLPDYVLYVTRKGNSIAPADSYLFRWNGSEWGAPQSLAAIGGDAWFAADTSAVQLLVPLTAIGAGNDDFVGSLAVTVFSSAMENSDGIRDSLPQQPGAAISNPAFVSDMLMPLYPFDTPSSNPIVFTELPSVRWRMPYFDSVDGYQVQVARDARFTDLVEPAWETYESKMWSFYSLMPAAFHSLNAYEDNESYYWRVRIRHERFKSDQNFFSYGPWSPPMRFKLTSRQPGSPAVSTGELALTTPSFSWQRVEGASGYTLQVDNDANFSSPVINEKLDTVAYTPLKALEDGVYFWRVAARRSSTILGQWTPTMTFTKRSLAPTPLGPSGGAVINTLPTFRWTPVITNTATLHMAAPRYRLQLDDDPNFSSPATLDTESASFTLSKEKGLGYGSKLTDGAWYWRVAVIDAEGHAGAYSPTQNFYKEYLRPALLSPEQGKSYASVPSFAWQPLDGAAYYEVRVANDENGVERATPAKTDASSYTPAAKLSGNNLYWRVQMLDDDGTAGPSVDGRLSVGDGAPGGAQPLYLPMIQR